MEYTLRLSEVTKNFVQAEQKVSIIKNASFSIRKGELVSLIGPSGSGKTTILQIAGLLDKPNSGKIIIADNDASDYNDAQRTDLRKSKIGFVYQFHHLLPEFSATENVALPLLIQGFKQSVAKEKALEILEEVELSDRANFRPAQLSGGQQQRVALARAIVGRPQLILADEPTGNLDSELSKKIFELLKTLTKKYQISCLAVTHNLELAKTSDRIIEIKNGVINDSQEGL